MPENSLRHMIPSQQELQNAVLYRIPAPITQLRLYRDGAAYPVCPHCSVTLSREYQSYCDRCGQALDWNAYDKAAVIPMP